jgi:hypothetical protein
MQIHSLHVVVLVRQVRLGMTYMVMMVLFCWKDAGPSVSISSSRSVVSELSSYLDSDTKTHFGSDFNILTWWKSHNQTYHILSILAKDVLTVFASTISSKSTFSLAGMVFEEWRQRVTTDTEEVLSCIKN